MRSNRIEEYFDNFTTDLVEKVPQLGEKGTVYMKVGFDSSIIFLNKMKNKKFIHILGKDYCVMKV